MDLSVSHGMRSRAGFRIAFHEAGHLPPSRGGGCGRCVCLVRATRPRSLAIGFLPPSAYEMNRESIGSKLDSMFEELGNSRRSPPSTTRSPPSALTTLWPSHYIFLCRYRGVIDDKGQARAQKTGLSSSPLRSAGRDTTVLRMARDGSLQKLRPGVYRPTSRNTVAHQDMAIPAWPSRRGHLPRFSALSYYGLTTTIPGETWIAIPKTSWAPKMAFPTRIIRLWNRRSRCGD